MRIEQRLAELGIVLPTPQTPVANYVGAVLTGNLLFLSGRGPMLPDGTSTPASSGRTSRSRRPTATPA